MNELISVEEATQRVSHMLTPVGLQLPERMAAKDYEAIAVQLKLMQDSSGWVRADLALRIKRDFPDDYEQRLKELAFILGLRNYRTLYNDIQAASKYSIEERERWISAGLSYSHCRVAAHVEYEQRDYALSQAFCEGWTIRQLEHYLFGGEQKQLPSRDAPLRERYTEWLDTLADPTDRGHAEYYVRLFLDWLE